MPTDSAAPTPSLGPIASLVPTAVASRTASAQPKASPAPTATAAPTAAPTPPAFYALDVLAAPSPGPGQAGSATGEFDFSFVDDRRPLAEQSSDWLSLKTSGRVNLHDGRIGLLDTGSNPLVSASGAPVAAARTLDLMAINWEVCGHDPSGLADAWYTSVTNVDPTLARDLQMAVMLDVGRDGVPVIAAVDSFELPNWQAGAATSHIQHGVRIVGYDNAANPPTYTYIDTCGRSCDNRGGNQNGQIHVISQATMVRAIRDSGGSGFVW